MYLLYKDLKRALWMTLLGVAFVAVICTVVWTDFFAFFILGFLLTFFLLPMVLEGIADKRYNLLLKKLENCHTADYIWEHHTLLSTDETETVQRKQVQLNLFAGLWDAGEFQSAWELLQSVKLDDVKHKSFKRMLETLYHSHMALVHLHAENPDAAQASFDEIKRNMEHLRDPAWRSAMEEQCERLQHDIRIKRGDFAEAYAYYTVVKNRDGTPGKPIHAAWQLHLVCEAEGRREEAASHLHFVADHGGDTYYAKEAKRRLAEYYHH